MCCIRIRAALKCLAKVIYPFGTGHQLARQMKWQLHEDNHPPGSCAAQQATCGKCKSKPQTFAENTQKCATSVVPSAPSVPLPSPMLDLPYSAVPSCSQRPKTGYSSRHPASLRCRGTQPGCGPPGIWCWA